MNIVSIDTAIVRLPLERPVRTTIQDITALDCVLVTVKTDEGITGIGYLWCFGIERARLLQAAVNDMGVIVAERNPLERTTILQDLWQGVNFTGSAGVSIFGISAIDMALWDIAGKSRDEPLYRLLGAAPRNIAIYAGGMWLSDPLDAIVAEARAYAAKGYRAVKMRVGSPRWSDDVTRVGAVREAVGPDVDLMIDATQSWTRDQAVRIIRELERFHPAWVEEPLVFNDRQGLAAIAKAIDTPVAGGENDYGLHGFADLLHARAVDIAMPDLQRVGGIGEFLKVCTLAEAMHVKIAPHVFPEIAAHLLCAVPNGFRPEYVDWWDRLFIRPLNVENGSIRPAERPGHGLDFDWDGIDAFRIS